MEGIVSEMIRFHRGFSFFLYLHLSRPVRGQRLGTCEHVRLLILMGVDGLLSCWTNQSTERGQIPDYSFPETLFSVDATVPPSHTHTSRQPVN